MANVGDLTDGMLSYRASNVASTTGGAAGANKLWLPLWSGEVINAYDQFNMFEALVTTKALAGGFSYEFPLTGTVSLNSAWDAGEELIGGTTSASTTIKVNLDKRPMAAHFETDNVDLLITQWDYRSELARQAGLTLANTRDRQLAVGLVAAGALPYIATDPHTSAAAFQAPGAISATVLASACTETEGLKVLQEIENYTVTCQENDVPINNVYCVVTPKVFQIIRSLGIPRSPFTGFNNTGAAAVTGVINTVSNYTNNPMFTGGDEYGGAGYGIQTGLNSMMDTLDYMGVKICKSNHIPKTSLENTANNIGSSKYNLNCSVTGFVYNGTTTNQTVATTIGANSTFSIYGIIFQAEALAALSLMGMKVDTIQDVRRNTQFTVASMMKGTGILKPELVKLLVSGVSVTRANVAEHLNSVGTSQQTAGNGLGNGLTNGFAAEYAVTQ
jgi:hypothetical protein